MRAHEFMPHCLCYLSTAFSLLFKCCGIRKRIHSCRHHMGRGYLSLPFSSRRSNCQDFLFFTVVRRMIATTRGLLLGHPMVGLIVVLQFCCICASVNSNSITLRRQNHEFIQLQTSHPRYPVHRRMMEALVTRGRAINMNGGYLTLGAYCKFFFNSSSHFFFPRN